MNTNEVDSSATVPACPGSFGDGPRKGKETREFDIEIIFNDDHDKTVSVIQDLLDSCKKFGIKWRVARSEFARNKLRESYLRDKNNSLGVSVGENKIVPNV